MTDKNTNRQKMYQAIIGTGGIGSGIFAALNGNQTLGREESRAVHFLDRRDYCKGHIISHYVKVLMGPDFPAILIGKVGADPVGRRLLEEIQQVGLDTRYIEVSEAHETLFSVCYLYPDGTGGNLTSADSASSQVDENLVRQAEPEFTRFAGRGIALAAPEVPLEARRELLNLATRHHFFRAGSFVSAEILDGLAIGLFQQLDLLALNIHEAAVLLGRHMDFVAPEAIVEEAVKKFGKDFPHLRLSITAGKWGSWCWDGNGLYYQPAFPARVVSTAGAGDAHLAGILAGVAAGLSIAEAQELGALTAGLAVESPHTIAPEVSRAALQQRGSGACRAVREYLDIGPSYPHQSTMARA